MFIVKVSDNIENLTLIEFYLLLMASSVVKNLLDPWVRKIPWTREWQPTPVFFPGQSHIQRSLAGYSPWGSKESDRTVQLCTPSIDCIISSLPLYFKSCQDGIFNLFFSDQVSLCFR